MTVMIQHERLADAESVEEMRALWKEHLNRLLKAL